MPLLIATPDTHPAERDYSLGVILGEFLGLPWRRVRSPDAAVRLRLSDAQGEIELPDHFFSQLDALGEHAWLTPATLPQGSLPTWDSRALAADITLTDPRIPLITHSPSRPPLTAPATDHHIRLPIDVFGAAFFMLSRYEEAVLPERDAHDRFPSTASLAQRAGFLDRPIIDEYVEILWSAMQRLWPQLQRRPQQARTLISCDLDSPFAYPPAPAPGQPNPAAAHIRLARRLAADLLKHRSPRRACQTLDGHRRARHGDFSTDPHHSAIDWMMDVNERAGNRVAFYLIPENTHPRLDNRHSLDHPQMRALLRRIHTRGHEIGLHPGYNTYKHPDAFARSVATLRRVLDAERLDQPRLGGRQHFLRWETPTTARLWDSRGLDYDTTLSYADRPGFRCGTCREYPLYDLTERRPLRLRERPLIVMECSVIAERYLGLGYSDQALDLMQHYRDTCRRFQGDFSLLWHNSHLDTADDRRFYQRLVA